MNINIKGLSFKSIYKISFIGILVFGMLGGFAGFLSGISNEGGNFNVAGIINYKMGTGPQGDINTKNGLVDFAIFIVGWPIATLFTAAFVSIFTFIGQVIYTKFKPLEITFTNKGLDAGSTFKLYVIGWLCSWTPLAIFLPIYYSLQDNSSISIGSVLGNLIAMPFLSIIMGSIISIAVFVGHRLFTLIKPINLEYAN
jgi:hypothetical protein